MGVCIKKSHWISKNIRNHWNWNFYWCNSATDLADASPFKNWKLTWAKPIEITTNVVFFRTKSTSKSTNTYRNLKRKDDIETDDEISIYYMYKKHHINPLWVYVNINMQSINFDTGSSITLTTSETNHLKELSDYELSHIKTTIKS